MTALTPFCHHVLPQDRLLTSEPLQHLARRRVVGVAPARALRKGVRAAADAHGSAVRVEGRVQQRPGSHSVVSILPAP